MAIAGYTLNNILGNLTLHFALGFTTALVSAWLISIIRKTGYGSKFLFLIGLCGGIVGIFIDVDHLWSPGRHLHIPFLVIYSLFVLFYIIRRDKNNNRFALLISLWLSIATHVLEDYIGGWF